MRQSRLGSLAEALVNAAAGLFAAMFLTAAICKAYGIQLTWDSNFIITFWMTVFSVMRSYLLRRVFEFDWVRARASVSLWWTLRTRL